MAAKQQPFVTGDRELDAILATFEQKEVRKAVRKATRKSTKRVLEKYRKTVETEGLIDTGAMRDVPKVRAVKRSRRQFGHEIHVDRKALIATRQERGGAISQDNKRAEPFFYFAAIEFGPGGGSSKAPLRKSLYGDKEETLAEFRRDLREALMGAELRARLKAGALARGEQFFQDETGRWQNIGGGFARLADVRAAGLIR